MIAHHAGNGLYSVEKTLNREGIYYVKVQARSKGSTIMPTKQFIVGEIKEEFESTPKQEKELHHEHHETIFAKSRESPGFFGIITPEKSRKRSRGVICTIL